MKKSAFFRQIMEHSGNYIVKIKRACFACLLHLWFLHNAHANTYSAVAFVLRVEKPPYHCVIVQQERRRTLKAAISALSPYL